MEDFVAEGLPETGGDPVVEGDDAVMERLAGEPVEGLDSELEVPYPPQDERRMMAAPKAGSRRADVNSAPRRPRCCRRNGASPGRIGHHR